MKVMKYLALLKVLGVFFLVTAHALIGIAVTFGRIAYELGRDLRGWVETAPLANFLYWGPTRYTDANLIPNYEGSSLQDSDFDYDLSAIAAFHKKFECDRLILQR